MVYFDDTNNKNKTPGSNSISVYNKDVDDYVIYNKTNFRSLIDNVIDYMNSFIFKEILSSIRTFLVNIQKGYDKITQEVNLQKGSKIFMPELKNLSDNLWGDLKSIERKEDDNNKAVIEKDYSDLLTLIIQIKNYFIVEQKFWKNFTKYINNEFSVEIFNNYLTENEKNVSEIYDSLSIAVDNKKVNLVTLRRQLYEALKPKKKNLEKTNDELETALNTDPLKTNLNNMFSLDDPYNKPYTMKYTFYSTYYNNLIKPNFFNKDGDNIFDRDVESYNDLFNHPKMLMTYNDDLKDNAEFAVFDMGIILRYIFDYDIVDYIGEKEKYNNYNFPTWFKYDSNNIINIDTNSDVLSDDNFKNLQINS
jgi:hypothetical protein